MAEVGFTAGAADLGADHAVAAIGVNRDCLGVDPLPKTGPARAGIKLAVRTEQIGATADTRIGAPALVVPIGARKGPFGAPLPGDAVLLGGEALTPLGIVQGFGALVGGQVAAAQGFSHGTSAGSLGSWARLGVVGIQGGRLAKVNWIELVKFNLSSPFEWVKNKRWLADSGLKWTALRTDSLKENEANLEAQGIRYRRADQHESSRFPHRLVARFCCEAAETPDSFYRVTEISSGLGLPNRVWSVS